MERVFLIDIRTERGDIRFHAGEMRDYPVSTWKQIADAVGEKLDEITASKIEAGALAVKGVGKSKVERVRLFQ